VVFAAGVFGGAWLWAEPAPVAATSSSARDATDSFLQFHFI
jgi:hypothetical protein